MRAGWMSPGLLLATGGLQSFDIPGDPPADLGVEVIDVEPMKNISRLRRLNRPRPELWGGELGA